MVGDADYLFLNDYRHLDSRPLLDAFPGRIIVLHDGDLTAMTKGRRAYAGLHAVRNAILSGDAVTRATAFGATEETGEGPLLLSARRTRSRSSRRPPSHARTSPTSLSMRTFIAGGW